MRRLFLIAVAACLGLLAFGLFAFQWVSAPTTLRIAVGPMGSDDTRLIVAVMQELAREREAIRLKLVLTDGTAASAAAIEDDTADLAIVRTDVAMPAMGQTVAIMHRDAALMLSTEHKGISKVSGLWGRNIGVLRRQQANTRLLETILGHYEIPRDSITTVRLNSPDEVEDALRSNRIDAVLAVGALGTATLNETVAAAVRAGVGPPVFIPVGEAAAMAQRLPVFEPFEIVRGTFGGSPPRPPETVTTLGVSHRLVAHTKLDENLVSEFTRLLFAMRPGLSKDIPLANRIEQPDTAKGSALPVHPGAAAYYEGQVLTFFERYGDWFYLGVMVVSILGSAAAALASAAGDRSRVRTMALLDQLLRIIQRARVAESEDQLRALETEADQVLATALGKAGRDTMDQTVMVAMFLGLDQARRAIHEQRLILEARHAALPHAAE
jgi:TRAP transporter TAXI family solute receptor